MESSSDTEETEFKNPDLIKLEANHSNQGYLDGFIKSKNKNLQVGFDRGYILGSKLGLQVGRIFGILQGLKGRLPDNDLEKLALKELSIENLFSSRYWDVESASALFEDTHPLVEKWNLIVDHILEDNV